MTGHAKSPGARHPDELRRRRKYLPPIDLSSDSDSPDIFESGPFSRPMGPPPLPLQRRSAPLPDRFNGFLQNSSSDESTTPLRRRKRVFNASPTTSADESMTIGSPQPSTDDEPNKTDENSKYDRAEGSVIKSTLSNQNSHMGDLSPLLAAFKPRATATTLSAYNLNHDNPNYTDLEDPHLPDHLEKRLEAMRAENAKEHHHDRIPAEDAPPHMQMMVLFYQWAAWALDISDQKKRERMIKWVNGRTLDFMMSGGRIPGYDLKSLLEIAGVDPKELYGWRGEPGQQNKSMADLSSTQLGDSTTRENGIAAQDGFGSTEKQRLERGFDQAESLFDAAQDEAMPAASMSTKPRITQSDGGGADKDAGDCQNDTLEPAAINREDAFTNSDGPLPAAASDMVHDGDTNLNSDGKRVATLDIAGNVQDNKRQKVDMDTATEGHPATNDISKTEMSNAPQTVSPASKLLFDLAIRDQYRQTVFKAQLNAVLKANNKSQLRKAIPEWSQLERRLRDSALSINIIRALRDDFHNGWKTWDGSAFSGLPQSLQNNSSKKAKIKAELPSPTSITALPRSIGVTKPLVKPKDNPKTITQAKDKAKANRKANKISDEEYDSADGEFVAARSVSPTRPPPRQPSSGELSIPMLTDHPPSSQSKPADKPPRSPPLLLVVAKAAVENASNPPINNSPKTSTSIEISALQQQQQLSLTPLVLPPHTPLAQHIFQYRALHFRFHPQASQSDCYHVYAHIIVPKVDRALVLASAFANGRQRGKGRARSGKHEEFWLGHRIVAQGYWAEGEGIGEGVLEERLAFALPLARAGRWLWERRSG